MAGYPKKPKEVSEFGKFLYKSQDEIRAVQNENLQKQVVLLEKYSPYYSKLFKDRGISSADFKTVDDLEKIPSLNKKDYMADPMSFRLTIPPDAPVQPHERIMWGVHYTTGTTSGVPTPFFSNTHDYFGNIMQLARMCEVGAITNNDIVANIFPLTPVPHIGFWKTVDYCIASGARCVSAVTGSKYDPFPIHNPLDHAVDMVERYRCTVLSGIVSFVRRVIMRAEELGRDFSSVRHCFVLGEACPQGMRNDMRSRLENTGAKNPFICSGLGFTEMQGTTLECTENGGMHICAPDLHFLEIIDEKTGKRLPDGEQGLLAITHIDRRGTCFLRYIIGDITTLTHETCPNCGRNDVRVEMQPIRTMELVNIKGTLINPDILKTEITEIKGIEEYQIVFTKEDKKDPLSLDKLEIKVAIAEGFAKDDVEKQVVARARKAVEMTPEIVFVDMKEIFDPTKTLKSQRVVDERPRVE
ncbi:MAG: AMP-binding protein [Deltaproteobacteria bacterium]|nr:AMP-binding protein [Deltaproteobacteria bacterium]